MAGIGIARHSPRGKQRAMSGLHKGSAERWMRGERRGREGEGTEWNAKREYEFLSSSDQPITTDDDDNDDDESKGDTY